MSTASESTRAALLHVCGRFLPLSETFTYDWISGLTGFDHHVVASSVENLEHFPLANVSVPPADETGVEIADEVNPRAIVCHFGPQATTGMPIALALNRPIVTIFHGYDISRLLRDRVWVERYLAVARLGMQAICISNAGRARLLDIGWPADQITVIRLGVDSSRFEYRPPAVRWAPAGPRRALMVARLVPKKGADVALGAMRRLQTRGSNLHLRIVGDGPERERLERLIAEWRLFNVTLLGALEHARTREEFADADLYIQPSLTAESGDQEGIPVSLMEALASGLPAISTHHAGIPELIRHDETGLLTDEGDEEGLATAMDRVVSDANLAQRLAEAGRAHVFVDFDRDRQMRRFAAYVDGIASNPQRRPLAHVHRGPARRPRRGLVIGSIPAAMLIRKLTLLAARHPDIEWDVIASQSAAYALVRSPLVNEVHSYPDGRLSLKQVGLERLLRLKAAPYDAAVVMFGDDSGAAHGNGRRLAREVAARHTSALTLRDREVPLSCRGPRLRSASPASSHVRGV